MVRSRRNNRDGLDGSDTSEEKETGITISESNDISRSHSPEHITVGTRPVSLPAQSLSVQSQMGLDIPPAYLVTVSSKHQTTAKVTRGPFILLDSPILKGSLQLGTIVQDPKRPLTAFTPSDQARFEEIIPEKFIHRLHQSNFEFSSERSRKGSLGFLTNVAGLQTTIEKSTRFQIAAPDVWRVQLRNHEEVLNVMVADDQCRGDVITFLKDGNPAYMIVGLLIMNQSQLRHGDDSGSSMGGDIGFDVGISAGSGQRVGRAKSATFSVAYNKVLIHGIQYRALRMKKRFFSSRMPGTKAERRLELEGYAEGAAYQVLR